MNIIFDSQKLEEFCENQKASARKYGTVGAKLLQRRLGQLRAATTLDEMRNVMGAKCEELKGDRAGQLSIRLHQAYRLIFEVADDPPPPPSKGGGLDWKSVRSIRILDVEDYH